MFESFRWSKWITVFNTTPGIQRRREGLHCISKAPITGHGSETHSGFHAFVLNIPFIFWQEQKQPLADGFSVPFVGPNKTEACICSLCDLNSTLMPPNAFVVFVRTCVSSLCRLSRASQTYLFPIHLTDQLLPSAVFYATVGPLLLYVAVHRLIVIPYTRAQKRE